MATQFHVFSEALSPEQDHFIALAAFYSGRRFIDEMADGAGDYGVSPPDTLDAIIVGVLYKSGIDVPTYLDYGRRIRDETARMLGEIITP